ncbi:MAG: transglutaminase family protein [Bacteroidota bacterium]|nr:MAG: transglutaminase family protein [Bacteroidota bacterium]
MRKPIQSLISLLDDKDLEVNKAVTAELMKHGLKIIPQLEKVWESTLDGDLQQRIESLIHFIQVSHTHQQIKEWLDTGATNLLEGAVTLAQIQYPNISLESISSEVERIASDVNFDSGTSLTAYEKINLLNYVIFDLNHFTRNSANFYSPSNSFINYVLETRKGNPVSLGILYLSIARKLKLPVYGVNLPKAFVLAYINEYRHVEARDKSNDILFYINPYNNGAILTRFDVERFIVAEKLEPKAEYFLPCNNEIIMERLIVNLIIAYEKIGYNEKVKPLQQLLKTINKQIVR